MIKLKVPSELGKVISISDNSILFERGYYNKVEDVFYIFDREQSKTKVNLIYR
jgi:hypothetical protein